MPETPGEFIEISCKPAMKFYMTHGSYSTGIHILLEVQEFPFEVYLVNLMEEGYRL